MQGRVNFNAHADVSPKVWNMLQEWNCFFRYSPISGFKDLIDKLRDLSMRSERIYLYDPVLRGDVDTTVFDVVYVDFNFFPINETFSAAYVIRKE